MAENNENKALETQEVKETKPSKPKKKPEKKPFFLVRMGKGISKWFRELKGEAKKVVWPTGKQVVNNTLIVIGAVLLVSIFVYVLDIAFGTIRDFIVRLI